MRQTQIKTNFILLLLLSVFVLNGAMMVPSARTERHTTKQAPSNHLSIRQKVKQKKITKRLQHFLKKIRKITNVVDGGALLLAIGAVVLAAIVVYFMFTKGFFIGVLAVVAAAFLLYLLFQYLEY